MIISSSNYKYIIGLNYFTLKLNDEVYVLYLTRTCFYPLFVSINGNA